MNAIRCPHCRLNQFDNVTACRRCHKSLIIVVEPTKLLDTPRNEIETTLGRKVCHVIKLIRLAQGFTQKQVGSNMGSPRTYLSKVERMEVIPCVATLERLSSALGISMYGLVLMAENCHINA